MMNKYIAVFAAFVVLLSGCASVTSDIVVDAATDPKIKLSGYKTYAWVGTTGLLNDPMKKWQPPKFDVAGDIKYLIDRDMRKRGMILSEPIDADLAVGFFIGIDMEAMELKTNPETKAELLNNVPKGALVVVLIDTTTGYVVWVGKATAELNENATDKVVRERLAYAINEMFRKMPNN